MLFRSKQWAQWQSEFEPSSKALTPTLMSVLNVLAVKPPLNLQDMIRTLWDRAPALTAAKLADILKWDDQTCVLSRKVIEYTPMRQTYAGAKIRDIPSSAWESLEIYYPSTSDLHFIVEAMVNQHIQNAPVDLVTTVTLIMNHRPDAYLQELIECTRYQATPSCLNLARAMDQF